MSAAQCEVFRELVSAFVDEQLDGEDLLRLEAHLEACRGCRAFEGAVRNFKELLPAAEAFRPLRRPPPGFAAMVAARAVRQSPAPLAPFPEVRAGRRAPLVSWLGLAAAAAAAVLFFAWSGQRLLGGDSLAHKLAVRPVAPAVVLVSAAGEGNIESWLHEHAMVARDGTLLGPAEEVEFANFNTGAAPQR